MSQFTSFWARNGAGVKNFQKIMCEGTIWTVNNLERKARTAVNLSSRYPIQSCRLSTFCQFRRNFFQSIVSPADCLHFADLGGTFSINSQSCQLSIGQSKSWCCCQHGMKKWQGWQGWLWCCWLGWQGTKDDKDDAFWQGWPTDRGTLTVSSAAG